jgi:hypothetical protein
MLTNTVTTTRQTLNRAVPWVVGALRVSSLLFLLAVLVQAGLAGLFVTGDVD